MTQKIRSQAAKFWTVLSGSETLATYAKAANLTGQIFKEAALLIWLVLCLVLVGLDLGTEKAIATGRATRTWLSSIQKTESNQIAADTKQKLLAAGKASVNTAIAQARQQLGLPEKQVADSTSDSDLPMKSAAPLDGVPNSVTARTDAPSPSSPSSTAASSSFSSPNQDSEVES